jgi:hypothetical protein
VNLSKKYATKQFNITPSFLLIKWLVILHSLAVIVAIFTPFSLIYKILTIVLVLASLAISIKQEIGSKSFILRYTTVFGWEISHSNQHFDSIEILPSTVLTTYMIFLHYRIDDNGINKQKNKAIMIVKDALIDDDFRQLRVELRISGLGIKHNN